MWISVILLIFSLFEIALGSYYSISGSSAYRWKGSYPQSCECMETGVSISQCTYFRCTCTCDINAGKCDYGCCCDPDCSSDQKTRFNSLKTCLPEGYQTDLSGSGLCYSSTELAAINPRLPLVGIESTAKTAVDEALCIQVKNFALPGVYYTDVDTKSNTIFSETDGKKKYSYVEDSTSLIAYASDANYDQNDTIPAFLSSSPGWGLWRLPLADYTGTCNGNQLVRYEVPVQAVQCVQDVTTPIVSVFTAQCTQHWSIDTFARNLRLASRADGDSTGTSTVSNISVSIRSLKYFNFFSGFVTPIDQAYITVCNTSSSYSTHYMSMSSPCSPGLTNTSTSTVGMYMYVCASAVKEAHYEVTHEASALGYITSAVVDLVLTDVPFYTDDAYGSSKFLRSFSVVFTSTVGATSQDSGNQVSRIRSGNPGYRLGSPLAFGLGSLVQNASASVTETATPNSVLEQVGGFTIPLASGTCPTSTSTSTASPVLFGYDVSSGCTVSLNRTQLRNLCCQGAATGTGGDCPSTSTAYSPYSDPASGLPFLFNYSTHTGGYMGIYGNADPLDIDQWYAFSVTVPTAARAWDETLGVCSNMYTGMNYKFLVSKSGELHFPQNKIIAAVGEVTTSNLVSRIPGGDEYSLQRFSFTVTVSFVYKSADQLEGYVAPPPPVLFKVPYDAFYPFQTSGAGPGLSGMKMGLGFSSMKKVFSSQYFMLVASVTMAGLIFTFSMEYI